MVANDQALMKASKNKKHNWNRSMRWDFIPFFWYRKITEKPARNGQIVKNGIIRQSWQLNSSAFLDKNNKLNYQTLKYHLCGKKYKKENSYIYYRFENRSQQNKLFLPFLRICRYKKVVKVRLINMRICNQIKTEHDTSVKPMYIRQVWKYISFVIK